MDIEKAKRYSLMEVVLLAVFVFGLLIAHIIVKARGTIQLSEPIELPLSGMKVSMPINPNWQYVPTWQYESDNSLTLIGSRVRAGQNQMRITEIEIRWRYNICTPAGSSMEILYQRAEQANANLERIEVVGEKVPIQYAEMTSASGVGKGFFIGVARLEFGRSVELQVLPHGVDPYRAEAIFRTVASSLQYVKPHPLMAGKNLVRDLWKQTDQNFSEAPTDKEDAFLIKDAKNNTAGFYYDQYSFFNNGKQGNCRIYNRHYTANRLLIDSTFWLDGAEQSFSWKTSVQHLGMGQPREYTLTKSQDGEVKLKRNFDKNKTFQSDGGLLPELMLGDYIKHFLKIKQTMVVVDVIAATGQVVPTKIETIALEEANAQSEMAETVVKVVYLNQPNSYDEFYYDAEENLIGRVEHLPGQGLRFWDPTTASQLKLLFGEMFKRTDEKVALNDAPIKCEY
ncbi:MAG: hypothetical protein ACYTET_02525 [Planctomycetota bacterium]